MSERPTLALILSVLLFLPSLPAQATEPTPAPADCPDGVHGLANTQVARTWSTRSATCNISATARNNGERWRSYSVNTSGSFMVFNNFGTGSNSTSTGARNYFFFPRRQNPTAAVTETEIVLTTASGNRIHIDAATSRLASIEGGTFTEDRTITSTNGGGVEITALDGLTLDTGFRIGESSYARPNATSILRDRNGRTCQLVNRELFHNEYVMSSRNRRFLSESYLRFRTDAELLAYLRGHPTCSALDLSPLEPAPAPPPSPHCAECQTRGRVPLVAGPLPDLNAVK